MSIPTSPDITPTPICNPMTKDFRWDYKDENNYDLYVIIPFLKVTYLPRWMADVVKEQLAVAVFNERGWGKTPIDDMKKLIHDEIEVSL